MNCVQAAITEYNQPDNVVDFCQHRDLDGILGELSPLCATLNITPETLRIAAQDHSGSDAERCNQDRCIRGRHALRPLAPDRTHRRTGSGL
jgi:hypothetical protein